MRGSHKHQIWNTHIWNNIPDVVCILFKLSLLQLNSGHYPRPWIIYSFPFQFHSFETQFLMANLSWHSVQIACLAQ